MGDLVANVVILGFLVAIALGSHASEEIALMARPISIQRRVPRTCNLDPQVDEALVWKASAEDEAVSSLIRRILTTKAAEYRREMAEAKKGIGR